MDTQTFRKKAKQTKENVQLRDRQKEQELREKYIAGAVFLPISSRM